MEKWQPNVEVEFERTGSDRAGQTPEGGMSSFGFTVVTDKDTPIPGQYLDPHYSDPRYRQVEALTAFLEPGHAMVTNGGVTFVEGAHYNYDDRLVQHDYTAYQEAAKRAEEIVGNGDTARFFEEMLRILYKQPQAELVHILAGVNRSNGYSFRIFGTIDRGEPHEDPQAE